MLLQCMAKHGNMKNAFVFELLTALVVFFISLTCIVQLFIFVIQIAYSKCNVNKLKVKQSEVVAA